MIRGWLSIVLLIDVGAQKHRLGILVGGNACVVNHYRRKEEESTRMYVFGGREEKSATDCVYLVQHTVDGAVWLVQRWSVQQLSVQQRLVQ